ncbi:STE20/SPS1-related proline-alanine-rich protein kinase-like isoform X1 [Zingiber officinale]|uniref:STE20/SPS1-related proline-alanine-rich protein kinase-like isoform X1 n=1 Tax=Zingiber officinale TaxID=94328 RepID=UPI001C4C201E|nr:STE20/SPS1-related proline-alanine-rich protein kinase-like isoform X1 [Zingiber officinale]
MGRNGSVRRSYSASPNDYKLLEEVGYGASATVYRAIYLPSNEFVAVKRLDLDRCNSNLDDIRREAQTMSLIDHPNVIRAYCSFVVEQYLWVVMPFMAGGSCLHLMKIAYPDGFEEPVICSILKETLKALEYLHRHGHIHRDVKAGNILLDSSGVVKLGDFGVSACMFDKCDRQRSRNTFVGTPCWMAPEVLQPGSGYDFKADIWSFGITALELAHGHAPFSKYPPMKVLLMTLQNAPPGLDYDRDKKFSKSFKEMIAMCLVKDQTKRPTAEKLLKHSLFKHAKPPEILLKSILSDLPPLWDCVKALQLKDAAQLVLKKMPSSEQEALSQSEYQRGVSAWNFDIEDLKAQASLIQDDDDLSEMKEDEETIKNFVSSKDPSTPRSSCEKSPINDKTNSRGSIPCAESLETKCSNTRDEILQAESSDASNQERLDQYDSRRLKGDLAPSTSKPDALTNHRKVEVGKRCQTYSGPLALSGMPTTSVSERVHSVERVDNDNQQGAERYIRDTRKVANLSGPLMLPNRASANSLSAPMRSSTGCGDSLEDKIKPNVVQIKGRFSVTSENVDLVKDLPLCNISRRSTQESPLRKSASVGDWVINPKPVSLGQPPNGDGNNNLKEVKPPNGDGNNNMKEVKPPNGDGNNNMKEVNSTVPAHILKPHLENLFQQTSFQQDLIMNLLNSLQQRETIDLPYLTQNMRNENLLDAVNSERERILLIKISELQARMITLTDELTAAKLQHIQLQQELNGLYSREENKRNEEIAES